MTSSPPTTGASTLTQPDDDIVTASPHEGRDVAGRFTFGNQVKHGSPHIRKVAEWRKAWVEAVTDDDLHAVARVLVESAKAGKSWAVKEFLNRTLGKVEVVETQPQQTIGIVQQVLFGDNQPRMR